MTDSPSPVHERGRLNQSAVQRAGRDPEFQRPHGAPRAALETLATGLGVEAGPLVDVGELGPFETYESS